MKDRQRIHTIFLDRSRYEAGGIDVTELFYKEVDKEGVEAIKYVMPSATKEGMYYTIVYLTKKAEDEEKKMGF